MITKLQLQTIRSVVDKYKNELSIDPSRAFLFFIIDKHLKHLELNETEIDEAIIDGGGDGGIDAIYIDESDEKKPLVYIFQSKYSSKNDAYQRTFSGNALEKMKGAIDDFIRSDRGYEKYGNALLQDKIRTLNNLLERQPKYIIVFCSNTDYPSSQAREKFDEYIEHLNKESGAPYFEVQYLHLDKVTKLLIEEDEPSINEGIQFTGKYLNVDTGDARLLAGITPVQELVKLVEKHGDKLFEKNVRGFLKRSNMINKKIIETSSGDLSPYFVYMNNGITITCDKMSFRAGESPNVKIEGLQVVNGQQTIRSLREANQDKSLKDDTQVIVRIVETSDKDLLGEIIEATNNQTRVTSRDLHSNDDIQKLIEQDLKTRSYYYEARKNKYQGRKARRFRVDAERAAQAYYAAKLERPALAKDKKKLLFGDEYENIFTEDLNIAEFLTCFLLLENVGEWNKLEEINGRYSFIKDAALHSVALLYRSGIETLDQFDNGKLSSNSKKQYLKILRATGKVVSERAKQEGDKYEHRRTFKDPETYGRIVEVLDTER